MSICESVLSQPLQQLKSKKMKSRVFNKYTILCGKVNR